MVHPRAIPPIQTLSGIDAHQAVGSLVAMYTGILADYERQLELLRNQLNAAIVALRVEEAKHAQVPSP
jgi:hypothetical protein